MSRETSENSQIIQSHGRDFHSARATPLKGKPNSPRSCLKLKPIVGPSLRVYPGYLVLGARSAGQSRDDYVSAQGINDSENGCCSASRLPKR